MLSGPKNSNHVRKVKKATDFLVVLLEDIGEEERITVLYYVGSNCVDVVTGSWKSTIA